MIGTRAHVPASDKLLAFIFGIIFLSAILVIAIMIPNPSDFSYSVFRIVLALAAAGVGAVIPGFLNVEYRSVVRAGGAIALFVIVYFFPPVPPSRGSGVEANQELALPPASGARAAAEQWLGRLDRGDYSGAYGAMSEIARRRFAQDDIVASFSRARETVGRAESRSFDTSSSMTNPPGSPKGEYLAFGFKTKFSKVPHVIYESVHLYGEGNEWKPIGSFLFRKTENGQMVPYSPAEPAPASGAS